MFWNFWFSFTVQLIREQHDKIACNLNLSLKKLLIKGSFISPEDLEGKESDGVNNKGDNNGGN